MTGKFLLQQGIKLIQRKIEKRGGLGQVANDVYCATKAEVDKRGGIGKIATDAAYVAKAEVDKRGGVENILRNAIKYADNILKK